MHDTITLLVIALPIVLPRILDALLPPRRRGGPRATGSKASPSKKATTARKRPAR